MKLNTSDFIESIAIVPSRPDSIFSEHEENPTETYNVTKSYEEWKTFFLNPPKASYVESGLERDDVINLFGNSISKFKYFMTASTGLFHGITVEAKTRALRGTTVTEIITELSNLAETQTNIVIYSVQSVRAVDPITFQPKFGFKIRYGTIE